MTDEIERRHRFESIDPGSGTTPAEYLVAVREDVGGATLRRLTWAYSVAYSRLGSTPALVAPADARPLRRSQ
ncbi:MAG: hypothetical protein HOQ03_11220 [Thermoleophilia bacterium]|nr:hypothetical protein [Thermoleophilia bacterium]